MFSNPNGHKAEVIPTTFSGAALQRKLIETVQDKTLNAAAVVQVPADTTRLVPENIGGVGDAAPLTSVIKIKKGQKIITVNFLFDSGSEASYFAAGNLQQHAQTKMEKKFRLLSLSTKGGEETVE